MPGMRVNRKRGVLRFNVKLHSGAYVPLNKKARNDADMMMYYYQKIEIQ